MREGKLYTLYSDDQTLVYVREYTRPAETHPSDRLLMVLNNSDKAGEAPLATGDTPIADVHQFDLIGGKRTDVEVSHGRIKLPAAARSLSIYELK